MIVVSTTPEIRNKGCSSAGALVSAGLKRNQLTPSAKREHLADAYKITGGDADKIIVDLYGPQ